LQTEPFLGPVSRYHAAEAASVLPSWEKVSAWAGGSGALQIETSALARSGGAILVLFPEDAPVGGAYHHPFYLSHSASLSGIPQGTYRLLLFSSGARPFASEAFSIQAGETTTLRPSPARLEEDESCRLIGGEVPLWAVDPADEDHISNDYNLSCRTEIWAGRYVYQMLIPAAPNHRFRSEVDFQFTVDCADRSLHGEAVGSASVFVVGEGECALSDFTPDSFTVALSGFRRLDYIELELDADSTVHTMEFECSGTPVPYTVVVPDVPASLLLRVPDYGEVTFPPGIPDLPENTIYLHIYVTQLF
jgi:hypothetical protein